MIDEMENWRKAGQKTAELMAFAQKTVRPGMPLLEIAEKIEEQARKQKAQFAFPVNLCINGLAAHYCPEFDDRTLAQGLLKIDLGISVDGFLGDQAITIDFTENQEHKELMEANQEALDNAIKLIKDKAKEGIEIRQIGKIISDTISKRRFSSVKNLSGHELQRYNLHAGITIPNYDNGNKSMLKEGIYAIEPFATYGEGIVRDWKPSNIFMLKQKRPARGNAQKILRFIEEEYKTLPFASRWILNKFGKNAILSLNQLEKEGILHHFPQLKEKTGKEVSQFEHTIAFSDGKVIVLTKED